MAEEKTTDPNPALRKPEPKIRTMKSDVAEYIKEAKPSLIQILTKQVEHQPAEEKLEEEKATRPLRMIVISAVVVLSVAGFMLIGYRLLFFEEHVLEIPLTQEGVASPIAVSKTVVVNLPRGGLILRQTLSKTAKSQESESSLVRLDIRIKETDGGIGPLQPSDLFEILEIQPPAKILDSLGEQLFLYIYHGASGPRSVLITQSRDLARTFGGMINWENSIQRDLEVFFFEEVIPSVFAPFLDKTFRNIDYRFLEIKPELGIAHAIFPAKKYLVITTSQDAMEVVISRLLEAK